MLFVCPVWSFYLRSKFNNTFFCEGRKGCKDYCCHLSCLRHMFVSWSRTNTFVSKGMNENKVKFCHLYVSCLYLFNGFCFMGCRAFVCESVGLAWYAAYGLDYLALLVSAVEFVCLATEVVLWGTTHNNNLTLLELISLENFAWTLFLVRAVGWQQFTSWIVLALFL